MSLKVLGGLALLAGVAYIVWPGPLLALNDRICLLPGRLSQGFVRALGVLIVLIGLFLMVAKPMPR